MNVLQKNDINELLTTLKGADEVDIIVRKDGQDIHFEADWLRGVLEYFVGSTGITTTTDQRPTTKIDPRFVSGNERNE